MNDESFFSDHWHRVSHLRVQLAANIKIRQHLYRGVASYVLHQPTTCDYIRVSANTYALLRQFDGNNSVDDIWKRALDQPRGEVPSQPEMLDLLARLHVAELLKVDAWLDADSLFARGERRTLKESRQRYLNPLNIRVKGFDPDRLTSKLHAMTIGVSSRMLLTGYMLIVGWALFAVIPEWSRLQSDLAKTDFFSPLHIGLFLLVYPLMKALHELAHALVLKRFGGSAREAGVALLVLLPIPYVDCSAAAVLPDKRQRMLVSAAGMLCELLLAAIATLLWMVSQGALNTVALMVMITGTVSTLLFNGNPLLRFDGYYLLADAIEIPNLASRSRQTLIDASKRLFLGQAAPGEPIPDRGERAWLMGYALVAGPFRIALMLTIAFMLSHQYFVFGLILAIWVVATQLLLPTWHCLSFAANSFLQGQRRAALTRTVSLIVIVVAIIATPLPRHTVVDAVVWIPEDSQLRAPGDCEIMDVQVSSGMRVTEGDPLLHCEDVTLMAELAYERGQRATIRAERQAVAQRDEAGARILGGRLTAVDARIDDLQRRRDEAHMSAATDGQFITVSGDTVTGRYYEKGDLIGFVIPRVGRTIRAAVRQSEMAAIDSATRAIQLQFSAEGDFRTTFDSAIVRVVPKASRRVVSASLTRTGGGRLGNSGTHSELEVDESVFDVELEWPDAAPSVGVGSRIRVRFEQTPLALLPRTVSAVRRAIGSDANA